MISLRAYQAESVERLDVAVDRGENPLCVLPTGAGKSLVMAAFVQRRLARASERALVLSHVAELLEQDSKALHRLAPEVDQSFFVAGLKEKNPHAKVVFGSVQSVVRSLELFRVPRQLVFVDEAHLCPRRGDAMYAQVFAHFMQARRIGMTATPKRLDSGSLLGGSDAWFNSIAHEVPVGELIEQGFLLPLVGVKSEAQANLSGVRVRGGDFIESEAAEAVRRTLPMGDAVDQVVKYARKRKSWLVFAASIDHAKEIAAALRDRGVRTGLVTSESSRDDRSDTLDEFRSGELRALVNVGVLTTGFDAPCVDCIVSMRPTQSDILWTQILGRGMRLAENKTNCLLLDFVGNLERLGGVGRVTETFDFRSPEAKLASKAALKQPRKVKPRERPELFDVSSEDPMVNGREFEASVQRTKAWVVPSRRFPGRSMVLVTYDLEDEQGRAIRAREFLLVEYPGNARYTAERWFARRGLTPAQVPATANDACALVRVLEEPDTLRVRYDPTQKAYVVVGERFVLA